MAAKTTSRGSTAKYCTCRDKAGKSLGADCPQLKRNGRWSSNHGAWRYQFELPPTRDGKRRNPLRRKGFATENAALAEIDLVRQALDVAEGRPHREVQIADYIVATVKATKQVPTVEAVRRKLRAPASSAKVVTFAELLDEFEQRCRQKNLAAGTLNSYTTHIRLYFKPYLGHLAYDEVDVGFIGGMFDWIDEFNDTLNDARNSPDPTVRAAVKWRRRVGTSTKHRIRATGRAALNMYIKQRRLDFNAFALFELPPAIRPKALVWTDSRVEQWTRDFDQHLANTRPYRSRNKVNTLDVYISTPRPSPVMVWTPAQAATFLETARTHPLYALYRLIVLRGLRRGEAVGLRRADTHPATKTIDINWQITQDGWDPIAKPPKSAASNRTIGLDDATATALETTLIAQDHTRDTAEHWTDTGYTFTDDPGHPYHPQWITDEFYRLSHEAGLPPIQVHGARHTAACLMHAAGADIKDIQETLGHSTIVLTSDTYTSVFHTASTTTAQATAKLINTAKPT